VHLHLVGGIDFGPCIGMLWTSFLTMKGVDMCWAYLLNFQKLISSFGANRYISWLPLPTYKKQNAAVKFVYSYLMDVQILSDKGLNIE
jgi:predicted acyltransferase